MLPNLDYERRLQALERFMREIRGDRGASAVATWTPTWTGLTVVGTPTYAGRYTRIGQLVFFTVEITAGGANTTASTAGTTFVNNLPLAAAFFNACVARDMSIGTSLGVGGVNAANVSTPTWGATNSKIIVSGWYEI